MNFTITETSVLFGSMFQNVTQQDVAAGLAQTQDPGTVFAGQLDRMMGSVNSGGEATDSIRLVWADQQGEQFLDQISTLLEENNGQNFISGLKSILLSLSNGSLEDFKVDLSGLATIEKILLSAGFNEADVEELILEMSEKADEESIDLGQVFEKIQELEIENQAPSAESILAHDDALFLESVLTTLGFSYTQIQETFASAERPGETFSLDSVISQLHLIQQSSFYFQTPYQVPETNNNFKTAAAGMGLDVGYRNDELVTLGDVVKALEQIRIDKRFGPSEMGLDNGNRLHNPVLQKMPMNLSQMSMAVNNEGVKPSIENPAALLAELFKTLKLVHETEKSLPQGVHETRIKDRFDNQVIMGKISETGQKNLLGMESRETIKNTHPAALAREAEAIVNQASSRLTDQKIPAGESIVFKKVLSTAEKPLENIISGVRLENTNLTPDSQSPVTKPKPLPAYVAQQVGKSVIRAVNQGNNNLTIQLKPHELGRLLVNIENTNQTMRVNIMTENHAAKEIITQNLTELKSIISSSGISLERFEVDMSSDFRQSMADARQQAGNSDDQRKGGEFQSASLNQGAEDSGSGIDGLNIDGSVHLVA